MTRTSPIRRAVGLLVLSLSVWAPQLEARAQPARPQEQGQSADQLFEEGKMLYLNGKVQAARDTLAAAWALKKSYDIAANLATTEIELGLNRDAAEHFAYCIRTFPSSGPKKNLAHVQRLFDEVRTKIGALSVKVSVDGAEVFVDGKSVGRAPLKEDVFVEPGARTVEAKLSGYEDTKQTVQVGKGGAVPVSLSLSAKPGGGGADLGKGAGKQKGTEETPPLVRGKPNQVVLIAGAAAAGVALVTGVVLGEVASSRAADADERLRKLQKAKAANVANPCESMATDCKEIDAARRARDGLSNGAMVAFIGAGVLAAGTAAYWLLAPSLSRPKPAARLRVLPAVAVEQQGVMVVGAW